MVCVTYNITTASYELLCGELSTECFLRFIYRPMKTDFTLFKNATARELFQNLKKKTTKRQIVMYGKTMLNKKYSYELYYSVWP